MVGCKYGCSLIYDWRVRQANIWIGLRRFGLGHHILQLHWCSDRLLFLNFWSNLRASPDGSVPILVRLVGCQAEYEAHLLFNSNSLTPDLQLLFSTSWLA